MSKAEEESRINSLALTFLERQQIRPNIFADQIIRGYKEGYHQAEKDFAIVYVVTRCEEHSDYVEEVFFDEDKAQAYCDQFKGNESEYARHITKVNVTL